ncbi:DMT family transporter [Herbaspirillum sp. RTI4]|uniref:DMT family transporter n=1 Tax=Herbaspirillum sp. RTI4 TaxID=3048640 RepID=UPI002AB345DA|nr:DMT family transporter [Herbaspirillum sp. RTI4]MDY7577953.1 DMT family transporter [Herbaspirillum sp. RTI4]MEA9981601.1 DMT family transporter [Herbaspirillum sp. RTI4]
MQSLWMLFAAFCFSIMGMSVKLAADYYSTAEIVLCRGLVGVLFILCLISVKGGTLRTPFARDHLIRGGIGVASLWMWFLSFRMLPVATATTLNYMSSIWMAGILFFMAWRKGVQRFEWRLAGAIVFSFVGVALLLRPAIHGDQLGGALIALISGVLSAIVYLQVRKLGLLGEPEYRVVFYFSLTGLLAGVAGSIANHQIPFWHPHTSQGILLLLTIGLTATVAQMAMTRAYRLGNTLVTANLQYSGIVFASMWSILVWGDVLGWSGWLGISIILISGMMSTFYNQRSAPASKNLPAADPIASEV